MDDPGPVVHEYEGGEGRRRTSWIDSSSTNHLHAAVNFLS